MLIRNFQIARKTEQIIKKYLFQGTYPKLKNITNELSDWLREHNAGSPTLKVKKVFKKDITNSNDLNEQIESIDEDLKDSYNAAIIQHNQVTKNFTQGEIIRERFRHDIDEMNNRIDNLLSLSTYADSKYIHQDIISFENANNIDVKLSDADIDLMNRQVTLKERTLQSKKIRVAAEQVTLSVDSAYTSIENLEPISNAFDDSINSAWWAKVVTREHNTNNQMTLATVINLQQETEINTIDFIPHHTKEMFVTVEYSLDNVSFMPINSLSNNKVNGPIKWNFKTIKAKYLKIKVKKNGYDDITGQGNIYYFGAKNIGLYKKSYEEESYLYSKELQLPANSKQLSIVADKIEKSNTEIEYEICLNPNTLKDNQKWQKISDGNNKNSSIAKAIKINDIDTISVSGRKVIPTGERINGVASYKILKNDGSSIFTPENKGVSTFSDFLNAKLYRGIHQWRKEKIYVEFNGDTPINAEWDRLYREKGNLISTEYFMKTNALPLDKGKENFYRFTICVYSTINRQMPLAIDLVGMSNNELKKRLGSYSVYCNQKRMVSVNDEVTLNLVDGWNEIQILAHIGDVVQRNDFKEDEVPPYFLIGKTNFVEESIVRADLFAMELTTKESLFYNVSPLNHDYFAIDQQQVLLNYEAAGTVFELIYDNKDLSKKSIPYKIRAKLKRDADDESATPIIKNIKVRTI